MNNNDFSYLETDEYLDIVQDLRESGFYDN